MYTARRTRPRRVMLYGINGLIRAAYCKRVDLLDCRGDITRKMMRGFMNYRRIMT